MYTNKNILDIDPIKYSNYKLCYIDSIERLDSDFTKESKDYMETEEYKSRFKREGYFYSDKIKVIYFNNKDFIPGVQEYLAYFTPLDLKNQWGDDWNDIPYEHNAGYPYDDKDIEILTIPFSIPSFLDFKFPKDYGNGNSFWSIKDINMGAIPWLFTIIKDVGYHINAGINPIDFSIEILQIYKESGKILKEKSIDKFIEIEGYYNKNNETYITILDRNSNNIYFYKDLLPIEINTEGEDDYYSGEYHYPIFSNNIPESVWKKNFKKLGFFKILETDNRINNLLLDRILNPIKFIDGKIYF